MDRAENMRRIRSKNTAPEISVRKLLYSLGFRYRLHPKHLPGRPDIVFPGTRKAIFVHGCFWHSHGCKASHTPKTNAQYWGPKLARNSERHSRAEAALSDLGWDTLVVWECQTRDQSLLSRILLPFVRTRFVRGGKRGVQDSRS